MRKTAPALLFTTLFALASGSAFALGDRAKEKKSADGSVTSSQSATTSSGMSGSTNGSTLNKSQVGQNDTRCDESKYPSRSAMPKDCLDSGTGASASGGTQGQSGGADGASGAGPSGTGSGASGSSSGGASK